jgi:hypothetical protein
MSEAPAYVINALNALNGGQPPIPDVIREAQSVCEQFKLRDDVIEASFDLLAEGAGAHAPHVRTCVCAQYAHRTHTHTHTHKHKHAQHTHTQTHNTHTHTHTHAMRAHARARTHPLNHTDMRLFITRVVAGAGDAVRHFALHAMECAIRLRWNAIAPASVARLKQAVLALVESGTRDILGEARFVKEKLVTVVVEIAKRDWPQRWDGFVPSLVAVGSRGPREAELAVMVCARGARRAIDEMMTCDAPDYAALDRGRRMRRFQLWVAVKAPRRHPAGAVLSSWAQAGRTRHTILRVRRGCCTCFLACCGLCSIPSLQLRPAPPTSGVCW